MKNLLNYYYHIYPDKVFEKNDVYYFFLDEIKYYFLEFDRSIEELRILIELTNTLYEKGIKVHTFIKNISDSFFVIYLNKNYVLLRVNSDEKEEIDLIDVINFNRSLIIEESVLHHKDWQYRWTNQVDTFEEQIKEYNQEYPMLLNCFDYYIGLAENAIEYLSNIEDVNKDNKLFLSHKRVKLPLNYGFLYNPLNFMFDLKVRDIAEYIKAQFFNSQFDFIELENYINANSLALTLKDIQLLYARLLYPTYYFDCFELVISNKIEEKFIRKYTELSEEYEYFLFDVYNFLKNKYNIEPIDWIMNKN